MMTMIRPSRVLIFAAVCMLQAPMSHARRTPTRESLASQKGKRPATSDHFDAERMSSMGHLAHLAATGRLDGSMAKARAGKPAGTSVVVDGAIFDQVAADTPPVNDDNEIRPAGGQSQPSIAVDSTGRHIVIGLNDTRGFGLNPASVSGFMYSDDGGQTFTDAGQLPVTTEISFVGTTAYPQVFGDPEVKYLGGSTFVYFSIMVKKFGAGDTAQTLGFHRSIDFGHTWTGPFEIPPATNPNGLLNGLSVDAADKPFADVDPDTARLLVSWSNFTPFTLSGIEISATFSDNILSDTPTWSARSIVGATAVDGQSSIPRFAGNGSPNVYMAWRRFPGDNTSNTGLARSTDNGATWSTPVNASSDFFMVDQVLGNDRVNSAPGLAVDNSSGPGKGNIYLVYSNNDLKDGADIVFQRSTDGGISFTSPLRINSRPGNDRSQWYPWVTVDNSSGRVYVFYYDQGIATNGDLTETTYQFSDDYGLTWRQPMPLTARPFKAGWGNDTGQPNLGDYNQAVAQNGEFFAAWAQTKLLPFTDGLPSERMGTPDIAFKRVPARATKVSLNSNFAGTTLTDANGNGFIDAGEQVRFKIPLLNYVTNRNLNPSTITGILATLSATTSSVTVVQGISGYPSIAPGAFAANDRDFIVQLSPSYVRGTPLNLSLNVTSNQGSTVLFLTRPTGTPLLTTIFQQDFESVPPGSLPGGWLTQHAGGNNTVPWTTSNTFNAGNNGAFHVNANDGLSANSNRWERLLTPQIDVPANSEYVTLDFDVKYDTEEDPDFNILAYDGFLLRIGDYGPTTSSPVLVRSLLAEAFEEEFTTADLNHYPKHLPRSHNTAYFQDMSAWAGNSAGLKHVHAKLNGMAGRSIRLWWEYTQDESSTCNNVRPNSPACGVLFDNLVVKSVVTVQSDLSITKSITSGRAISGENITYTIDATNSGPTLDVSSTVTDNLPPLLSFVSCSATGGGTCDGSGNSRTVTLPPGSLPQTITLVGAISCSAAGGTPLRNIATIASSTPDPDASNNFSAASTNIVNPLPAASCPADIVTTAPLGAASAAASFTVTATDNCPLPSNAIATRPASGSAFPIGRTKVTATVTDSGGDQSTCSFNVTVNAPTTTAVGPAAGQYSDAVNLTAAVSPTPLSGQNATGSVNFFVNGRPAGSSRVSASGVAVLPYTILQGQGTYSITANYVSTNPFFQDSSGSGLLTVTREDAAVTLSSSNPGSIPATNPDGTASFSLSAAITEVPDGSAGDISNAVPVSFTLTPVSSGSPITVVATTSGGAVGMLTATASFTGVPLNTYEVIASIGGDFYRGSARSVVVVVNTPTGSDVGFTPVDQTTGRPSPISFTFGNVTGPGTTTVASTMQGPPPPAGFRFANPPTYYDIRTTAIFTGTVQICINYSGVQVGNERNLRLWRYSNNLWFDVTVPSMPTFPNPNTTTKTVCGATTSFSLFALAEQVNWPPTANSQSVRTKGNNSVAIKLTGADRDGDTLLFNVATQPAHGTLSGRGANLQYTPARNYIGPDSFSFTVSDGVFPPVSATVSITVYDDTPPLLSVVATPKANNAGWNNGPVSIVWTSVDPESGIAFAAGCDPVKLSADTAGTLVSCKVTNGAGLSSTSSITVRIDTSRPEAHNQFDPVTKTVQVFARDALSGVPSTAVTGSCVKNTWGGDDKDDDDDTGNDGNDATANDRRDDSYSAQLCNYTITDAAGNKLVLVEKLKQPSEDGDHKYELKVHVISTQYNNDSPIAAPHNRQHFQWSLDKDGSLKTLDQIMVVSQDKNRFKVVAKFDAKKNQTKIQIKDNSQVTKDGDNNKDDKDIILKPGLDLLRMATRTGLLDIEF